MSIRLLQINLHHSKAASAALLLRLTESGANLVLVQEPWVVGGKVAGLGTKEYKLMLDPKEGKIRARILAKRHLSIFLLRNYSNGGGLAEECEKLRKGLVIGYDAIASHPGIEKIEDPDQDKMMPMGNNQIIEIN